MEVRSVHSLPAFCGGEKLRTVKLIGSGFHLGRKFVRVLMAKKENLSSRDDSMTTQNPNLSLRFSKILLARSALVLFGLGFVDAGYSGDWSRIGVITRETEEVLKVAAYLVLPLCLYFAFTINSNKKDKDE